MKINEIMTGLDGISTWLQLQSMSAVVIAAKEVKSYNTPQDSLAVSRSLNLLNIFPLHN